MKNLKYFSNSWFIHSVWPSIWGWKTVDNFVSISNILFNFLVNSAANFSSLSDTILSGNSYNFYTLSLNNLANSSTNVSLVVAIKCVILNSLSQTTRIASFPAMIGNFVIKSTIKCIHSFFRTSLNFNFHASIFILFFIF